MDTQETNKILIIEDDIKFANTLSNLLNIHGYQSTVAIDGAQGIQRAFEVLPDLVLCDIFMKQVDGYKVYNVLKESPLTSGIPFIFITGKSDLEAIRAGMQLGADDYLVKPFENEDLLASVETRLKKYKHLTRLIKAEFEDLIEYSPNGIFVFNAEKIFTINQAFSDILGYSRDDIQDIKLEQLFDDNVFDRSFNEIKKCLQGIHTKTKVQVNMLHKNGNPVKVKLMCTQSRAYSRDHAYIALIVPESFSQGNTVNVSLLENKYKSEFDVILRKMQDEGFEVSQVIVERLSEVFDKPVEENEEINNPMVKLTRREKEVLKLVCKGYPTKIIADKLYISDRTVEKHRASLMEKFNASSIVEVIINAFKNNMIIY